MAITQILSLAGMFVFDHEDWKDEESEITKYDNHSVRISHSDPPVARLLASRRMR